MVGPLRGARCKGILLHSATWPKVESTANSVTPLGYVPGSSSATSCCGYATGRNDQDVTDGVVLTTRSRLGLQTSE